MVDNVKVSNMPGRFWPKGLDSVTVLLLLVVYVVNKSEKVLNLITPHTDMKNVKKKIHK